MKLPPHCCKSLPLYVDLGLSGTAPLAKTKTGAQMASDAEAPLGFNYFLPSTNGSWRFMQPAWVSLGKPLLRRVMHWTFSLFDAS